MQTPLSAIDDAPACSKDENKIYKSVSRKFRDICTRGDAADRITRDEMAIFIKVWEGSKGMPMESWVDYVLEGFNAGDDMRLYK